MKEPPQYEPKILTPGFAKIVNQVAGTIPDEIPLDALVFSDSFNEHASVLSNWLRFCSTKLKEVELGQTKRCLNVSRQGGVKTLGELRTKTEENLDEIYGIDLNIAGWILAAFARKND